MLPPLLFDEGLPRRVAEAFALLGLNAHAIGGEGAPPFGSSDTHNCEWCAERGAVLVTNDQAKGDRALLAALAQTGIHAIFVFDDLRSEPAHVLAYALMRASHNLPSYMNSKKPMRRRLRQTGGLVRVNK